MWINSNVVRRSPFLSPGQAVQLRFAVGKIEVRLAIGLMQRCFVQAFALWHNDQLTTEKGDFQRTDGINMIFFWRQSYQFVLTFWTFSGLNTSIWSFRYAFFCQIGGKCLFCFAISSLLFLYFCTSLLLFSAHLLEFCAWKLVLCLYLCKFSVADFSCFASTYETFSKKRRVVFIKISCRFHQNDVLFFLNRRVVFQRPSAKGK